MSLTLFVLLIQNLPDLTPIRDSSPVAYTVSVVLIAGLVWVARMYVLKDRRVDELQEKRVSEAMEALVITKDASSVVQELAQLVNQLLATAREDAGVKVETEEIQRFLNQFSTDLSTKITALETILRAIQEGRS